MSRQCRVGFRGVQLCRDDVCLGRIETEEARLQAGGDQALVEAEGEVVVLVPHSATVFCTSRSLL